MYSGHLVAELADRLHRAQRPGAILIWIWSALTRYSVDHTETAGATCDRGARNALQLDIPLDPAGADELGQLGGLGDGDEALRVFAAFTGVRLPPIRFMAMARVV